MSGETHRWTGNHPQEVSVGDKRVWLAEGDFVKLSKDDLNSNDNAHVIKSGFLLDLGAAAKSQEGGSK